MRIFSRIKTALNRAENAIIVKSMQLRAKAADTQTELADESGANTHTDVTIWIVIGVTLGAIALAALVALFSNVVMPKVEEMINNMFSQAG